MLMGDLNEVTNDEDKWGGRNTLKKRLLLKAFMDEVGTMDLGFKGYKFTWDNGREGSAKIKERLDRAVANSDWISLYPSELIEHLRTENSDHMPILIQTTAMENKGIRPFKFLEAWTTDDSSNSVIQEGWNGDTRGGMAEHKIKRALTHTSKALSKWNKESFGFAQANITRLEGELERIQREDDISGDNQRDTGKPRNTM